MHSRCRSRECWRANLVNRPVNRRCPRTYLLPSPSGKALPGQGAGARFAGRMTDDAATPETAVTKLDFDPVPALVETLGLPAKGVAAVIALLDEGNTVPFIARYRKERTGGLDEVQIRDIEEKRGYLVELEERRAAILASVAEQGKLTPELEHKLRAATGKAELED